MEVGRGQARVGERLADGLHRLFNEVGRQLVELRARERHVEVLRAGGVGGDVRQVDGGRRHAGQVDLRLLGRVAQALHGDAVGGEVDARLLLELR